MAKSKAQDTSQEDTYNENNPLTAQGLLDYLQDLKNKGVDLNNVSLNFRKDRDSDVEQVVTIEEDLFDEQTNNFLESLVFLSDTTEI